MELDEHVPVHVLDPEHPKYHAPSDDDIQVEDDDEDLDEDPYEEHKPEDEDTREPSEDSDETGPFEEDETAVTSPPPKHHGARISVRPQTPMASLGHKAAMIHMRDGIPKEDMPPQRGFAFIAPSPGYDIKESYVAAARAPRSQAEDVGYVRALQTSERRMMTFIEEVNLRINHRDIRLEIDVVRGQRTAYEIELQEVHQAYLSSEAQNMALLARFEILDTHVSRIEWQLQSAEELAVT
nr:hypothetical protein [Tanacetum cinerariifolium]